MTPTDPTPVADGEERRTPPPGAVVRLALVIYLPMAVVGAGLAPTGTFTPRNPDALGAGVLAALIGVIAVVAGSRWVSRHTRWGRALHAEFHGLLAGLNAGQVALLALLSALGEEFLFRGALHPWLGLWPTAVIFALAHFPVRRSLRPWTVFAFGMGVALGLLTDWAQSLWPAVLLHFGINQLNLAELARQPAADAGSPGETN